MRGPLPAAAGRHARSTGRHSATYAACQGRTPKRRLRPHAPTRRVDRTQSDRRSGLVGRNVRPSSPSCFGGWVQGPLRRALAFSLDLRPSEFLGGGAHGVVSSAPQSRDSTRDGPCARRSGPTCGGPIALVGCLSCTVTATPSPPVHSGGIAAWREGGEHDNQEAQGRSYRTRRLAA